MNTTVLAIDDSPSVLKLLAVRLKPEHVHLVTARNGTEGFALAVAEKPDLILLDVDMPNESGLEWCRRFKDDTRTTDIPVIFLTASDDVSTKVGGFDVGALDYVVKSCHPAELRARVRAALRLKRFHDLLAKQAHVDALTGLRNRAYFDERIDAELLATRRHGRRVSLVLADLDHFKKLNDGFGHPFGDEVLQTVAEILMASVRAYDAACRYGGEELALVLPDTPASGAEIVAERIRERLRETIFSVRGERVAVTASFGVADAKELLDRDGRVTARTLVTAADEALYAAKREGRDRVRLAPTAPVPRLRSA